MIPNEIETFVRLKYEIPGNDLSDVWNSVNTYPDPVVRNWIYKCAELIDQSLVCEEGIRCINLSKDYKNKKIGVDEFRTQQSIPSDQDGTIGYACERLFYYSVNDTFPICDYDEGLMPSFLKESGLDPNIIIEILIKELYNHNVINN